MLDCNMILEELVDFGTRVKNYAKCNSEKHKVMAMRTNNIVIYGLACWS